MNLFLFGGVRVQRADHTNVHLGEKQKQLLALLALKVNQPIDSDVLIDHIWGERLPANPLNSLQDLVRRLRSALGDVSHRLIVTEGSAYALRIDPHQIDTERFRKLAKASLALWGAEPRMARILLIKALECSVGELPEVEPGSRLGAEIEDLLDLRMEAEDCLRSLSGRFAVSSSALQNWPEAAIRWNNTDRIVLLLDVVDPSDLELAELILAVTRNGGRICKVSDSLLMACFDGARSAVEAAESIARLNVGVAPQLKGAIGFGPCTAGHERIEQLMRLGVTGKAGRILITRQVYGALGESVRARLVAAEPDLWAVGAAEAETTYDSTRDAPLTGRSKEMAEVSRLLADHRLVLLRGPGGIGKSRLAIEIGRDVENEFPDGVCFVDLTLADRHGGPVPLIIRKLGMLPELHRDSLETLVDRLASQRQLLILDNCEDFLQEIRSTVEALARHCPQLRVLATSRMALSAVDEVLWDLEGLSLSDTRELLTALAPGVSEGDEDLWSSSAVLELCALLEGIPLAIECAASLVRAMGLEQAAASLASLPDGAVLPVLDAALGGRGRHSSMELAVQASYRQLPDGQARFFERLSCLRGDFTSEDARMAIPSATPCEIENHLELLGQASLLKRAAEKRWRMLEPIRQVAATLLLRRGEHTALAERHAEHFLHVVESAEERLRGPQSAIWLDRLDACYPNLVAALSWTVENRRTEVALRLAGSLWSYWFTKGMFIEGAQGLRRALESAGGAPAALRARALVAESHLSWWAGDPRRTGACVGEALELMSRSAEGADVETVRTRAWANMGLAAAQMWGTGDYRVSCARLEESASLFESIDDPMGLATCLATHGGLAWHHDDQHVHLTKSLESLKVSRRAGIEPLIAQNLRAVGLARALLGHIEPGRQAVQEGLELSKRIGNLGGLPLGYCMLGIVETCTGRTAQAEEAFALALKSNTNLGQVWPNMLVLAFCALRAHKDDQPEVAAQLVAACNELSIRTGIRLASQARAWVKEAESAAKVLLGPRTFSEASVVGAGWPMHVAVKVAGELLLT